MTLRESLDLVKKAVDVMEKTNPNSPYFNLGRMEILLAQSIAYGSNDAVESLHNIITKEGGQS